MAMSVFVPSFVLTKLQHSTNVKPFNVDNCRLEFEGLLVVLQFSIHVCNKWGRGSSQSAQKKDLK